MSTITTTATATGPAAAPSARPYAFQSSAGRVSGRAADLKRARNDTFQAQAGDGKLLPYRSVSANDYDFLFKVLAIGDSGVGKTSLMHRLANPAAALPAEQISTIGVDFMTSLAALHADRCPGSFHDCCANDAACVCKLKLQLWDTAGQERFRTIISSYYRGAEGVLVVFDVTQRATFENVRVWLEEIERFCGAECDVVLVGNKADLASRREVSAAEAREYADLRGFEYVETSARDAHSGNVGAAFLRLARLMHARGAERKLRASEGFKPTLGPSSSSSVGGVGSKLMSMFCNIL